MDNKEKDKKEAPKVSDYFYLYELEEFYKEYPITNPEYRKKLVKYKNNLMNKIKK